jgi:hypothetical protein
MASLSYQSVADRVADRVVTGVERVEGVVVSSAGSIAGLARRVPTPPKPAVLDKSRIAGRIPSVRQIAETNFTVAEKVLAAQKHYAVSVLGALVGSAKPARAAATTSTAATSAAKPAAKPAKTAPARRPAAKKPSA